ncbi:hypothetical protein STVIR_5977 [Streptomyces viridochromogenes Tue57]|uniref:Uncharacterized protein n=1 Tax=Streptomyces viridochromogenes Tue57 TaxID=1160705 RepID=L8P9E4_STRVR|nr:hypothetical protein STVIR_5977 [Streptomyces viridochromogenes Tue57]
MNGPRLDGSDDGNGCVRFMNTYGTVAQIQSVSFTVTHGPKKPALSSNNAVHCPKTVSCDGARLVQNGECEAGTVFPTDVPRGDYTINAQATFSFLCDNATTEPCKYALQAGGPPPTPENPVRISANSSVEANIFVEGTETTTAPTTDTPDPDDPPQPDDPPDPETTTTSAAPEE